VARSGFIRIDDSQLRELEGLFSGVLPRELKSAQRIALNRTRRGAGSRVSQYLRTKGKIRYNLPAARVKLGLTITNVRQASSFNVIGNPKPISLTTYSSTRQLQSGGVSVAVRKGARVKIQTGFIRSGLGGAPQVFTRFGRAGSLLPTRNMRHGFHAGKRRTQIRALKGPSVAGMMRAAQVEDDLAEFVAERFDPELVRAINLALRRRR